MTHVILLAERPSWALSEVLAGYFEVETGCEVKYSARIENLFGYAAISVEGV